jgi:hypothetical protein
MAFEVLCPCCNARLKVDSELKAIIDHEVPKTPRKYASVDDALGALKGADEERERKFAASIEAERSKKDVLNRKFAELVEKTKGDTSKPIRDIDLD